MQQISKNSNFVISKKYDKFNDYGIFLFDVGREAW